MAERGVSLSPVKWFGLIISILTLVNIAVLFNIPVLRQISAFIFLAFVPGFLVLVILKLDKLGWVEKIVLSVGLSTAFFLIFGLLINSLSLAVGFTKPLATIPLLTSFSIMSLILATLAYLRNKDVTFPFSNLKLAGKEKVLLIVPSLFPLLSIVGMRIMNLNDNNVILMVLLLLIPAFVIFISFYHRKVPQNMYPSLIYLIGISLLLILSLRSNHVLGSDIHEAYYVFQTTLDKLHWSIITPTLVESCLSISLLPSIYHIFLNTNQEYLFKVLYSLLFSISPLVVYIIAKKYIGNSYAFIVSFFFMSQFYFLWTTSAAQTNIAILFFALAIMVLFYDGINEFAKKLLFIIFAAACIVSHYSTTYIFFLVLFLTWIGMRIMPWMLFRGRKPPTLTENPTVGSNPHGLSPDGGQLRNNVRDSKPVATDVAQYQLKRGITITIVILFFAALFFWYSQVTKAAFNVGVSFINGTLSNLNRWFLLESKGSTITTAIGKDISTIPQEIRVVFSWLTVIFIVIGILSTVVRYKRMVAIPGSGHIKPNFLYSRFESEYFVLALVCCFTLVSTVVLPYASVGYSMERTHFQTMVVLSPFFAIGGIVVARWLRAKPHWIMLLVLIPFFMSTTGTMYQIFSNPASIALNSAGREYEKLYVHDQESYAAKWLGEHNEEGWMIYTGYGREPRLLMSQGKIRPSQLQGSFILRYQAVKTVDGYIYLGYMDTTVNPVLTRYSDIFAMKSRVYSSLISEIYR